MRSAKDWAYDLCQGGIESDEKFIEYIQQDARAVGVREGLERAAEYVNKYSYLPDIARQIRALIEAGGEEK